MRASWFVLTGICVVVLMAGCGGAPEQPTATGGSSLKTAAAVQDMPPICPVTGHRIEDVKAAPTSVYEGKRYYFQCPSCRAEFDRDPDKYTAGFDEKVQAANKEADKSNESEEHDEPNVSETSH